MKTELLRDTNYSFIKTITNEEGKSLSRKIEDGTPEYGNTCLLFHKENVSIEVGNKVVFTR